jgi:hypothetical protein
MSSEGYKLPDSDWKLLLERISGKNCTPIIGSGAVTNDPPVGVEKDKWKFQYPIGATLAQEWATEFEYPLEDATQIERVAQFISVAGGGGAILPKQRIADGLAKASPPDFTLKNETHGVLARLELPIYITSNFDDYLERALLKQGKDVRVSVCRWHKHIPKDAPGYEILEPKRRERLGLDYFEYAKVEEDEDRGTLAYNPETDARYKPTPVNPLVYHFHGHMAWPASLVVTEDDYFEFLLNLAKEPPPFVLPCIDKVLGYGELLFLGYKLSDWDFRVLFRLLMDFLKAGNFKHIAVQLGPRSRAEAADQMKAENAERYLGTYLDKRNIKVYWGTCQEFIAELNRRRE